MCPHHQEGWDGPKRTQPPTQGGREMNFSAVMFCGWRVNASWLITLVIEFIKQCKWFGLSSTVHSCLFLVCAADVYFLFYVLFLSLAL